ncbi:MAG TPA: spore protease YyaC [Candidatus Blautia merdigallinarum]|uniref:Spore protease YyaC n=1 Tax=Candidatus Blautia merdigallinarum TaxID=2838495 RepID=A0A9D2N5P2_9FIRM|nr:spore protease YyaC [Candidatus Blautia merdigallinarum]
MSTRKDATYYIENKGAGAKLGTLLFDFLTTYDNNFRELVFVCIGSDRITGDSLGPLVGHTLSKHSLPSAYIYGTLSQPVHALNLRETIEEINLRHPDSLIIAIDASLGTRKHMGYLTISNGSLEPGLGVHKKLPPVGDISITGIVNSAGNFEHFNLQTARLSTVVQMADSIVFGVLMAHRRYFYGFRRLSLQI